ncbi:MULTISPECIES: hypothetical protein [unclassified Streptomyces]|uniref:hypothetical protein n=1 Tax=unclassified Streptomyces TaxID=2593676 RepID=UPI00364AD158
MSNPYQAFPPPPSPPPRRKNNTAAILVVVFVVIAALYGVSRALLADGSKSNGKPSSSPTLGAPSFKPSDPGNPESSSDTSSAWKVGDCGGPDPNDQPDGYRRQKCDAAGATFKAIDIKDAGILPGSIQCPAGTDLMIKVSISYNGGKSSGIPTNTVCGRNLSADHPGDAGAGGGQLVKGDCITDQAKEIPCAGAPKGSYKVLGLVKTKEECPSGTTEPMQLTISVGRPYDVICAEG